MLRKIAVECLLQWSDGHSYADGLVDRAAKNYKLSSGDRGLLQAILYGVLRNVTLLDHWIYQLRDTQVDGKTRALLQCGLCQLMILDLAPHAAVNETVNAAQKSTRGLVNACLRNALRRKEEFLAQKETLPLSTRESHPEWLVDRWTAALGEEKTEALLQWNQQPAVTYARANPLREGAEETIAREHFVKPAADAPGFYEVEGRIPPEWSAKGLAYFQDPATRHCVEMLAPKARERVLDACAAPGGKACLIAAEMGNEGSLTCSDSNSRRLPRLEQNLERLGVTIAKTAVHDWTRPAPITLCGYDAILLDVPCSNTGVLRRRVDARWRLQPKDIDGLHRIQKAILKNALNALKPSGRIVYSTCSLGPDENTELVHAFLAQNPRYKLADERIVTPYEHGTDGAYAALITAV